MSARNWWRRPVVFSCLLLVAVLGSLLVTQPDPPRAETAAVLEPGPVATSADPVTPRPCDRYASAGTPCVAAHSTVRALYSDYAGPLYRVRRASDRTSLDIGLLEPGGYANAPAQDAFCAGTACVITVLHDQSPHHNDLTIEGPGTAGGQDVGANATALPVTVGGHPVYGVYIAPGTGYRHRHREGDGVATDGEPEGMYMVASGTHVNAGCCFDYGNVEEPIADTGNGHMDAVHLGTVCMFGPCSGDGPWVSADLENGVYQGAGSNPDNRGNDSEYVTALLKNNGQDRFALKGADAQSGELTTWWDGALPDPGYSPMQQEGSIVLGTGGDNSNRSVGSFFEGAMTAGYPSDAADDAVQADVVAAGYSGSSEVHPDARPVGGPGATCLDVIGDDDGGADAPVVLWDCQSWAADQRWVHAPSSSLVSLGRCLSAASGVAHLADCDGSPAQRWLQQGHALRNAVTHRCLTAAGGSTDNNTALVTEPCTGRASQRFVPGARG